MTFAATLPRAGGSNGADRTAVRASASTSSALRPRRDSSLLIWASLSAPGKWMRLAKLE